MAILVAGGSSGIGRAIAERFARPGVDVFINYARDAEVAAEAAEAVARRGGTPHVIQADIGAPAGVRGLIGEVAQHVDRLDQLVHSAAAGRPGSLIELDGESLDRAIALNGASIAHLVREALPLLGDGSSVFFITSAGSTRAMPGYGTLGAPKALAEQLVRYLAVELADRGIRVNCVSPGALDTRARRDMWPEDWQARLEASNSANPSGRGLSFEDVAGVVDLMARPEFAMVQGQVVGVDGGFFLR